jgi:hypothetical protein
MEQSYRTVQRLQVRSSFFQKEDSVRNGVRQIGTVRCFGQFSFQAPNRFTLDLRGQIAPHRLHVRAQCDGQTLLLHDLGNHKYARTTAPARILDRDMLQPYGVLFEGETNLKILSGGINSSEFLSHVARHSVYKGRSTLQGEAVDILQCNTIPAFVPRELRTQSFRVTLALGARDHLLRQLHMLVVASDAGQPHISQAHYQAQINTSPVFTSDLFRVVVPEDARPVKNLMEGFMPPR